MWRTGAGRRRPLSRSRTVRSARRAPSTDASADAWLQRWPCDVARRRAKGVAGRNGDAGGDHGGDHGGDAAVGPDVDDSAPQPLFRSRSARPSIFRGCHRVVESNAAPADARRCRCNIADPLPRLSAPALCPGSLADERRCANGRHEGAAPVPSIWLLPEWLDHRPLLPGLAPSEPRIERPVDQRR